MEDPSRPRELVDRHPVLLAQPPQVRADARHSSSVAYPASFFTLLLSVQVDRDQGRETGLLHGDTVEDVSGFHGLAIVSDDQELGLPGQFPENTEKTINVGVIEGRVDLVQDAEGAWPEVEDGEEQSQPGQRPLTSRHEGHGLQPLTARLSHELHARIERIAALLGLDQPQLGSSALEESLE